MKLNTKGLIIVGLVMYVLCLLSLIPTAGVMKKWANDAQLSIENLSGDFWQGEATVTTLSPAAAVWQDTQVSWQFKPGHLLAGGLGFEMHLKNPHFELNGVIVTGIRRVIFRGVSGHISGDWLSYFIRNQRIAFHNDIQLKDLYLDINYRGRRVRSAEGKLTWPGGLLEYPAGINERSVMFPKLMGELDEQKGAAQVLVKETQHQGKIMELNVFGTGMSKLIFYKRMLQIVNRLNARAHSDESYLTVEQKLF